MTDTANWMSRLQNGTKLSTLSVPGTHDTCAEYDMSLIELEALVPMAGIIGTELAKNTSRCQKHDLKTQLDHGVRALDIRLKKTGSTLTAWHGEFLGGVDQKIEFHEIVSICRDFLASHNRETLFMFIKNEGKDSIRSMVDKKIEEDTSSWYLKNSLPTELTEDTRGKIILLRRLPFSSGKKYGIDLHNWKDNDENFSISSGSSPKDIRKFRIQDKYEPRGDESTARHNKRSDVYHMLARSAENTDESKLHVNFTSGVYFKSYGVDIPKTKAISDGVNPWTEHLFKSTHGLQAGLVMMDFMDRDLSSAIIENNFNSSKPSLATFNGYTRPDAALYNTSSELYYFFKGNQYWSKEYGSHLVKGPFDISADWKGIPSNLDAALYNSDSKKYYFFKGSQCWTKKYQGRTTGPESIRDDWSSRIPSNLDAATYCSRSEKYYFFKGSQFWTKKYQGKTTGPENIRSEWDNVPDDLAAALYNGDSKKYYFFKGNDCYVKDFGGDHSAEKSEGTLYEFPMF